MFKNGRASGTLTISAGTVHFSNDQGEVQFPLQGADVNHGGATINRDVHNLRQEI